MLVRVTDVHSDAERRDGLVRWHWLLNVFAVVFAGVLIPASRAGTPWGAALASLVLVLLVPDAVVDRRLLGAAQRRERAFLTTVASQQTVVASINALASRLEAGPLPSSPSLD